MSPSCGWCVFRSAQGHIFFYIVIISISHCSPKALEWKFVGIEKWVIRWWRERGLLERNAWPLDNNKTERPFRLKKCVIRRSARELLNKYVTWPQAHDECTFRSVCVWCVRCMCSWTCTVHTAHTNACNWKKFIAIAIWSWSNKYSKRKNLDLWEITILFKNYYVRRCAYITFHEQRFVCVFIITLLFSQRASTNREYYLCVCFTDDFGNCKDWSIDSILGTFDIWNDIFIQYMCMLLLL